MTTKHTPTPWHAVHSATTAKVRTMSTDIATCRDNVPMAENEVHANAARIVQCVNACEGIDDPAALRDELRGILDMARNHINHPNELNAVTVDELQARILALSRLLWSNA